MSRFRNVETGVVFTVSDGKDGRFSSGPDASPIFAGQTFERLTDEQGWS